MQPDPLPLYVNTKTAAKVLGLSRSSLEKARFYRRQDGPPYVVFGNRSVRYHLPSLLAWAQDRAVSSVE